MITQLRLVAEDEQSDLVLFPHASVMAQTLTVSSPGVRDVTEGRADDDGERDSTELFGARAVTLELDVFEDAGSSITSVLDGVGAFMQPRLRPYLAVTDDGWDQERRLRLRSDQWAAPVQSGRISALVRGAQFQWKVPDGVWEASEVTSVTVTADIASTDGFSFPMTFPLEMTPTTAAGATLVNNPGNTPSHIVARLYGPATGPKLLNDTTGEQIAFRDSLVLGSGEYVEVDTRERTARLLSIADASRLNMVDFSLTSWWRLQPGPQRLRSIASVATAGSAAVVEYRPAWL